MPPLYSLESSTGRCPTCDSTELSWTIRMVVRDVAADTRQLPANALHPRLVLGCDECGQTLTICEPEDMLELLTRQTRRVAEQSDIIAGWASYGERVKAKRREHGRAMAEALNEPRSENPEVLLPRLIAEVAALRERVATRTMLVVEDAADVHEVCNQVNLVEGVASAAVVPSKRRILLTLTPTAEMLPTFERLEAVPGVVRRMQQVWHDPTVFGSNAVEG